MVLRPIHDFTLNIEERILSSALSSPNELLLLLSSGTIVKHVLTENKTEELFSVNSPFTHSDGGFDLDEQATIYTLDSIVVVVNDFKRHGVVHYPNKYNSLRLWRGEYHADISRFPIALYKNEGNIPHLIYGNDWNHVQIMNLDTRQILTAAKSLIEENAEEDRIEFYKKHEETNKLAWPSPYDYFYGRLETSPDNKNFLSAGWVWGSSDAYCIYNMNDFILNPRINSRPIGAWEHENRAACWIDNKTVVVAYDPRVEGDDDASKESPNQLHFYRMTDEEIILDRKVDVARLNLVHSEIHFQKALNVIVVVSDMQGISVVSLDGKILFHDDTLSEISYNPRLNVFLKVDGNNVTTHELRN